MQKITRDLNLHGKKECNFLVCYTPNFKIMTRIKVTDNETIFPECPESTRYEYFSIYYIFYNSTENQRLLYTKISINK